MRTIAAFDFDGTLTYCDTLIPFLRFLNGTPGCLAAILKSTPSFLKFFISLHSRQDVKETLLRHALKGKTLEECQAGGRNFSSQLKSLLRPEALEKLKWHQNEGHETVIVSANLDLYLVPWGEEMGLTQVLSSQVAQLDGKVTGKLIGLNCWGDEKVRRLLHFAGPKENFILWAYGDTQKGDGPLLKLADYPFFRHF